MLINQIAAFLYDDQATEQTIYKIHDDNLFYFTVKHEQQKCIVIVPTEVAYAKTFTEALMKFFRLSKKSKLNDKALPDFILANPSYEQTLQDISVIDFRKESGVDIMSLFAQSNGDEAYRYVWRHYWDQQPTPKKFVKSVDEQLFQMKTSKKICVVSPFTYGKSAFINSLLGTDYLQEDILVKTAKATMISAHSLHWLKQKGKHEQLEGYRDVTNFKNRLNYIATLNAGGANVVNITIPNERLRGITLVDTPGLFGPIAQHDEITNSILAQADLIVYLLSPTQLGFAPYIEQLKTWQTKYQKRCVFVMNKMDLVQEQDIGKLQAEFCKIMDETIEYEAIFYVSSYFALKARQYENGELALNDLRKNPRIYVKYDEEIISGRAFQHEHVLSLLKASGIHTFEQFLQHYFEWK